MDTLSGKTIRLREKRLSDAGADYVWHTDPELARLDAVPPLDIPFSQYALIYASELDHTSKVRRRFAVETLSGKHIGNCGYYNIDTLRREAELGIMIGDRDYWGKGYGTDVVTTLLNHMFTDTRFKKMYLKTLEDNFRAQQCFKKCGFTPYGRLAREGFCFITMEIRRKDWEERQNGASRPTA